MKYMRIGENEITEINVAMPVIIEINKTKYTGTIYGKVDISTVEKVPDNEAVEEK